MKEKGEIRRKSMGCGRALSLYSYAAIGLFTPEIMRIMQNLEHALEQIGTGRIRENFRTFGKAL